MEPALKRALQPHPFGGFYLEVACRLDAACPGYLNRVLHASPLKRQAQFAAYAVMDFSEPCLLAQSLRALAPAVCNPDLDPVAQIARALTTLRARQIAQGVYGSLPDGFLGLLGRLGADPFPEPAEYRLAFDLFHDPANKARAKLLRQVEGRISAANIRVAAKLDPLLLCSSALDRVYDVPQVEALHAVLSLIRSLVPDATDEALRQSLAQLSPSDRNMSKWVQGWLRQMRHVPVVPPIPVGDPDLRLVHGSEMADLGRRFQNCAADRIGYIAVCSRVFYEWIGPGAPAVVELRCLQGGQFVIEDIRGIRNANPTAAVANAIRARLLEVGVLSYSGHGRSRLGEGLMNLVGAWDHGDEGVPEPFMADLLREAA